MTSPGIDTTFYTPEVSREPTFEERHDHTQEKEKKGRGLANKIINNLPFELHLPGDNYCRPGTKLQAKLTRGDLPINPLDAACQNTTLHTRKSNK